MEKYASNVVEKCIEGPDEGILEAYIEEICVNNGVLGKSIYYYFYQDLMKNNFGNYVIQKALKISINENRMKLLDCISKNIERLGEKKLIEKWRNILNHDSRNKTSEAKNMIKTEAPKHFTYFKKPEYVNEQVSNKSKTSPRKDNEGYRSEKLSNYGINGDDYAHYQTDGQEQKFHSKKSMSAKCNI
jgi:hypothetical protein